MNEKICKYRGKMIDDCSCLNKDMQIYECEIIGRTIKKCCGKDKCKKYTIDEE